MTIDENDVVKDTLYEVESEIKFDLDLSYESREETSFIDAYSQVVNVDFENPKDKHVSLICDEKPLIDEKYVVVVG